jgi:hypothetical protein
MRGQKKRTLTIRGPSATGQRKNTKPSDSFTDKNDLENLIPAGLDPSTPSKPRPKPRPLVKKAAKSANADVTEQENGEVTAAHALITLQNKNHVIPRPDNSPPINHYVQRAAVTLNLDLSSDEEEEGGEEDQLEDDVEEVDELEYDSGDSGEFMQQQILKLY